MVKLNIDIPVNYVTKKREWIDRDYRTKCNQIIENLCTSLLVNFLIFVIVLGSLVRVGAVGVAYTDFLCPNRPMIMFAGEERSVSLWLQNAHDIDEKVRIKIVDNGGGILSFNEGDYNVNAKTYDKEIKVNLKIPENAALGTKYNLALGFMNVPTEEANKGIGLTTAMNVNICVQIGEYVPSLSPETRTNTPSYIIIGIIALAVLVFIMRFILRKKKK